MDENGRIEQFFEKIAEILTAKELKILAQVFLIHSKLKSVSGINEPSSLTSSKEAEKPSGPLLGLIVMSH
jgi:hypothetical protein